MFATSTVLRNKLLAKSQQVLLDAEEKAEVIAEKIKHAQLQYVPTYGTFTNSEWWEEWLKQPHTTRSDGNG